jgi:hypothetical protein
MMRTFSSLLVLAVLMLSGCSIEQRLASAFVETAKPDEFLLLRPSYLFKYNLKTFEVPGADSMDVTIRDSILLAKSLFLKDVDDSVFLDHFTAGFEKGLQSYGASVVPETSIDTLLVKQGTPYVVNIAQFSLEEYIHPYSSEEDVYGEVVVIDGIDLNAVNYNVWMELGRMNTEKKNKVLFLSDYLLDSMNGTLKQNLISGKLSFDFTIDTMTVAQVYVFAGRFGEKSAEYLFDYLMNNYIGDNLPENYPYERYYYHYDRERKYSYPVGEEDRVIELDGF